MRRVAALVTPLALLCVARRADAGDPFEIQVYDGTANEQGVPGLELHTNEWATGHRTATPPLLPLHGQFHATLEPSFGILPIWEVGAYVQMAVRGDDGAVDWAGIKLRSKFVTPPDWHPHLRMGVNLEVSYLPAGYDPDQWGSEVRPILAWHDPDWLFAFNPIFDMSLAGAGASLGPDFQPAFKAARNVGPVALGLEYYGTFGPVGARLPLDEQEHYIYEVLDVIGVERWELNFGVGEGLTTASAGITVKCILGYTFERPTTPRPLGASNKGRRFR
jgi:hypothetical protein